MMSPEQRRQWEAARCSLNMITQPQFHNPPGAPLYRGGAYLSHNLCLCVCFQTYLGMLWPITNIILKPVNHLLLHLVLRTGMSLIRTSNKSIKKADLMEWGQSDLPTTAPSWTILSASVWGPWPTSKSEPPEWQSGWSTSKSKPP